MASNPNSDARGPQLILVMGVSGSGKSTVGAAAAASLGATFLDADDFHPPANVQKMSRGEPLTDDDRWPWLDRIHTAVRSRLEAGETVVLGCSALKEAYRERLLDGLPGRTHLIFLLADYDTLLARMHVRQHFMPPSLLVSQLNTLEPPRDAITVDAREPIDAIVERIRAAVDPTRP